MPAFPTVQAWLRDPKKKDFQYKYTCAREARTEKLEDEIIDIADSAQQPLIIKGMPILDGEGNPVMVVDNAAIQHARLRTDARHRHLEAMKPKIYGKNAGLGEELKTGLLAKMEKARGRLEAFNEEHGRVFDNSTGELVNE